MWVLPLIFVLVQQMIFPFAEILDIVSLAAAQSVRVRRP